MKKVFFVLLVAFLVSSLLYSADVIKVRQEVQVNDRDPNLSNHVPNIPPTDDLFDWQFEWPVGVGGGEAGIETDGTYMYTTKWNGGTFFRYAMDGTFIEEFSVTGCPGAIRDLAYDGQYFYGSSATNTVYEMDFDTQTVISTINAPVAVRAIAYDPVADGFWANNWSSTITLFDRNGTTLDSFPCGVFQSYYGFAWEDVLPDGPYLWGYSQDGPSLNQLVQFDIATGLETGVNFNIGSIFTVGTGIAGGLCISDAFVPGMWTICGTSQNTIIWGVELGPAATPEAPGVPTDFAVIPDAGGALEATIAWTCPTLQVNGDPLTDLDEMRVYRGEDLIYTDTAPVIGGPGMYVDSAVPASGTYTYSAVGFNDFGEGIAASGTTWVGEDVPNVVDNLVLVEQGGNGYLTWDNPTTGLNGGAFNNPILGYHILRYPDNVAFELTGIQTEFLDTTIPTADSYHYDVTAYNATGDGGTATSNSMMLGAGTVIFFDDFEAGIGNWNVIINSGQGMWTIYAPPYPNLYTLPPTSSGNVCAADSDETGSGTTTNTTLELLTALDMSSYDTVNIQFDNDFNAIATDDYCYVDVSNDGGTTWNNVLTFAGVDVRNTHEIIDITAYAALQPNVLVRFVSVQPGWDWWWAIDNVAIYGTGGGPNPFDPPENVQVNIFTGLVTWDPPGGTIYGDDFESYTVGGYLAVQSDDWTTWTNNPGSAEDAFISDDYALSGTKSVKVDGTSDLVLIMENYTTGCYSIDLNMYIPTGYCGYYNLQKTNVPGTEWGIQTMFDVTGIASIDGGAAAACTFPFDFDTWMNFEIIVDLDNDLCEFLYDGTLMHSYQWTLGCFGTPGLLQLGGANMYAWASAGNNPLYYFDDVSLSLANAEPSEDLTGYNVYLDGILQDYTTALEYQLTGLVYYQDYVAGVSAVYDDPGESDIVNVNFIFTPAEILPPENLVATLEDYNDVYLEWEQPSGTGGVLAHHSGYDFNGIGTGAAADWMCAARFDAADLAGFYGSVLTSVNVHIRTTDFSYVAVKIWEGGSFGNPGTEVYSADITGSVLIEEWTEHILTTPVPLVSGNEYWIGYDMSATGDHPSSVDAGPAVPGKGDWMFYSGIWQEISVAFALDYNWCIEGVVGDGDGLFANKSVIQKTRHMFTNGIPEVLYTHTRTRKIENNRDSRMLEGYKVYRDGVEIYEIFDPNELTYDDLGLDGGTYEYYVTAIYDNGESIPSNVEEITVNLYAPLNLTAVVQGNNNVFATWDAPGPGGGTGFYEDFEGTFPPDGWLKLNPDGGTGWEPLELGTTPLPGWTGGEATACPNGGSWQAYCTWTTGGAIGNDQWLITPQITVAAGDVLNFYMVYYFDSYADHVEILISTTVQNDVNAFDTVVDIIDFPVGSPTDWTAYSYNLTDFVSAGSDIYIAFRETVDDNLNDGSAISIDNVYVGEPVERILTQPITQLRKSMPVERAENYIHVPNTHLESRALDYYNIYRNGDWIDDVTSTFYLDIGVPAGTHVYNVTAVYEGDWESGFSNDAEVTVDVGETPLPLVTELNGNYPNPFNPETAINFAIKEAGKVRIDIFNIKGQYVKTLVNEHLEAAYHSIVWDGKDDSGVNVSSGVYFYKMDAAKYTSTKKMILMK